MPNPRDSPWYLLQNAKNAIIRTDPFPSVHIRNALPPNLYEEIRTVFPSFKTFMENKQGHELDVNTFHILMDCQEYSGDVVEFARVNTSPEFYEDLATLLRIDEPYDPSNIRLRAQWTIQYSNSRADYKVREMHIDKESKVYNSLFYVPHKRDVYGGNIQMFQPKTGVVPIYSSNNRIVNNDEMEFSYMIPYEANTYFAFKNGPLAIHRVGLRKSHPLPRQSINILAEHV